MHLRPVPPEEATGDVRRIYDFDLEHEGYISNTTRLYSLNPAAWDAYDVLLEAIFQHIDERRYELATFAAARALHCRYCVSAHGGFLLKSKYFDRSTIDALARDYSNAGLDPVDVAVMRLAEKVALEAYKVTPTDVEVLRGHGLTDYEIFSVVLAAAFRAMFSKSIDAMGCEPDGELDATNDLIDLVDYGSWADLRQRHPLGQG